MLEVKEQKGPASVQQVPAIAPLIVSASRSTDIPAFYGDWFMSRLFAGYAVWRSPFGGRPVYVSLGRARIFAFWSKNPVPFIPHLDALEQRNLNFFFLITLNDYEDERLEPGVPPLADRISTFVRLSERIGAGRMVWRFDPLLLSDSITIGDLLERIRAIGDLVNPFTRRLVVSFIDIAKYGKVRRNLVTAGCSGVREFTDPEVTEFARGLSDLNRRWGLTITACGERRDLSHYGIGHGRCIGYDLIAGEFSHDPVIRKFLQLPERTGSGMNGAGLHPSRFLKDPGQRGACGCIVSKDIGQYSTCPHGCVYCYANSSPARAARNYESYRRDADAGIFHESII